MYATVTFSDKGFVLFMRIENFPSTFSDKFILSNVSHESILRFVSVFMANISISAELLLGYRLTKCICAAEHRHIAIARNFILWNGEFVIFIIKAGIVIASQTNYTMCYVLQWPQYVHQTHIFRDYSLRSVMRSICIHLIYCLAISFFAFAATTLFLDPLSVRNSTWKCNMHNNIGRYDSVLNQTTTKSFSYYHSKLLLVPFYWCQFCRSIFPTKS